MSLKHGRAILPTFILLIVTAGARVVSLNTPCGIVVVRVAEERALFRVFRASELCDSQLVITSLVLSGASFVTLVGLTENNLSQIFLNS
jgi:hypothetical protein